MHTWLGSMTLMFEDTFTFTHARRRDMPVKTSVQVVLEEWRELEPRLGPMPSVTATDHLRLFIEKHFDEPGQ